MKAQLPPGYQVKEDVAFGSRVEGLLEIMFYKPKMKNAMNGATHDLMCELITKAQDDKKIKVILIHGGKFFGSGNDIAALAGMAGVSKEEQYK